ncbi:glycosyltransferase [Steroidobacter sp.]|uniref:glycosyltransferase n=1 Tax=Steroidobacter sp. TaxID=1978227 RepID=UPI001A37B380|nr:glycosyltransferase [Steroidobacter sp.]MBL8267462.1 glycosyltransferase [Steroidobacter sp.]
MRCLWISRHVPYPMNEGLKVYSAKLSEALAQAGAFVRVLGFGSTEATPKQRANMEWVSVPGARRSTAVALLNRFPLTAAVDSTTAYRALLEAQLREPWDAIVFDSYGAGWALERCKIYRASKLGANTILVHVSHNHEEVLWRAMAKQAEAGLPKRLALWQNYYKVRGLERQLLREVDLVSAITIEDEQALRAHRNDDQTLTLTPGYDGSVAPERTIDASVPRRAVIVGSFTWVVKRENLARFVEHADAKFAAQGIELVVAGDVPADLKETLVASSRATRFEGFVTDLAPFLAQARIAIVPELIGGGFKLKFLDYIFGRVPVATVDAAAAGLPTRLREDMITGNDFEQLTAAIIANIDRLEHLNRLQTSAFEQARSLYRWEDRGLQLQQRIVELQKARANSPARSSAPAAAASA